MSIDEPKTAGKETQHLLRSFFELAVHNDTPSNLKSYPERYIAVQYNAVVDQAASKSDPDIYGFSLVGPPGTQFNITSQIVAITALIGGMFLSGNDLLKRPEPPPSIDHNSIPTGTVIGGVIGGVSGLLLAIALGYLFICFQQGHKQTTEHLEHTVEPYYMETSPPTATALYNNHKSRFLPLTFATGQTHSDSENRFSPAVQEGAFAGKYRHTETTPRTQAVNSQVPVNPDTRPRQHNPLNEARTTDLVMILNERLQNEQWDMNEGPPDYSSRRG
ncbi:hypothetical protein V5O48_017529 [Marasmius crinis-equi]|uniref:Uncharacterized protein n=1 Tax=Marasmius crinis-equi TaxID=585013 RepID=A0ABR3ENV7_9AGAR